MHVDDLKAHLQGIVKQQPPNQGRANACDQFDDLGGFDCANRTWQGVENAKLNRFFRWGNVGENAPVAWSISRIENAGLAFIVGDGAEYIRFPSKHSQVVEQIACGKVIGAINQDIVIFGDPYGIVRGEALLIGRDLNFGVDRCHALLCRKDFGLSDHVGVVDDLALKV